jgi:hypothetical protein
MGDRKDLINVTNYLERFKKVAWFKTTGIGRIFIHRRPKSV